MKPEELNEARLALGLTIDQMAAAMSVHRNTWGKWVAGDRKPNNAAVRLVEVMVSFHKVAPEIFGRVILKSDKCANCGAELWGWELKYGVCDDCNTYETSAERICFDIYMSLHVSQVKYCSQQLKAAWERGREIREKMVAER